MKSILEALPHQPHFLFSPFFHFLLAHGPTHNRASENIISYFQLDLLMFKYIYIYIYLKEGVESLPECAWPQKPPWGRSFLDSDLIGCYQDSNFKYQQRAQFDGGRFDGAVRLVGADPVRGCDMAERLARPAPCWWQWGWALGLPHCFSGLVAFHCTAHSTHQCLIISSSIQHSFVIKCRLFTRVLLMLV